MCARCDENIPNLLDDFRARQDTHVHFEDDEHWYYLCCACHQAEFSDYVKAHYARY